MNWKRSITGIVSILLLAGGVKFVIACAETPDPADLYVSFFQNNVTGQPQYKPFYYTSFSTLYDPMYFYGPMPEDDDLPDGNTAEWHVHSNKEANSNDIDSFMVKVSYGQLKALTQNKSVPADVKNNGFVKYLLQPQNKEELDYMLYAKRCEPLCTGVESVWDEKAQDYMTPKRDTSVRQSLIKDGAAASLKTKNDFLKWRYAYQALRLAFYNEQNDIVLKLYAKLIGTKAPRNLIYARCLGIKAGALYRTHKKKTAAYLYSRVFDMSNDMKRSAYMSFIWATDSIRVTDLFAQCRNNHEKAVLLVMDGLHERHNQEMEGLKLLEKAYTLDPKVKGLDVVMTREINKAEERYMDERETIEVRFVNTYDDFYDPAYGTKRKADWKKGKAKYKTYLTGLNKFAQKMAVSKIVTDKAFWRLASSYIYFMDQQFANSKKQLELAGKEKMTAHEKDVRDIITLLCIVHSSDKITPATEAELLPALQAVEARQEKSLRFAKVYRDMMFTILTDRYMQQKDTIKALYCLARADRDEEGDFVVVDDYTDLPGMLLESMTIDKIKDVETFVEKEDKTAFEEWLTENTPYTLSVLQEMEGTKYIREMKFDEAVAVLSSIPRDEVEYVMPDILPEAMVSHVADMQRWTKSDSDNTYNKLEFAKKMATLQKTLEAQPRNGRIAYQYAGGLYSMSYYGRAHHAVDYYRGSSDPNAYFATEARKKLPEWKRNYYSAVKAQKYYIVAMNNMSDPEMKARCLFMAAKCLQKNCDLPTGKTRQDPAAEKAYYLNTFNNPYIEQFYNKYSRTRMYHEVYSTCSYFRDYVKRMH